MRLIDTTTLTLHEFYGAVVPKYCILSHRWETEEVTFQDLQAGKGPEMKGYSKIVGCCKQAILDGWQYAWIDSCCIDKTSSAEMSEAINSMFLWYREAQVCYAFLSDVPLSEQASKEDWTKKDFEASKWFTRGWTLQELLAPEYVVFYDKHWEEIGTKSSLADVIQERTGIRDLRKWDEACVAQKMSWASSRQTTRIEDMAYSLLGIFGVFMPPLYGERENAFIRLQVEIINKYDDESIFAWTILSHDRVQTGMLAPSPQEFKRCNRLEINRGSDSSRMYRQKPYILTNLGLRLEDALVQAQVSDFNKMGIRVLNKSGKLVTDSDLYGKEAPVANIYFMPLNCTISTMHTSIGLVLKKLFGDHFVVMRRAEHDVLVTPIKGKPQPLAYVKQYLPPENIPIARMMDLRFMIEPSSDTRMTFMGGHIIREPNQFNFGSPDTRLPNPLTLHGGHSCALKFIVNGYGLFDSVTNVVLVLENEKGSPGIHLLQVEIPVERQEQWNQYKYSGFFQQRIDRRSLVLQDGTTTISASLKRMQGPADFKVSIEILIEEE